MKRRILLAEKETDLAVLRTKSAKVTAFGKDLDKLIQDMIDSMRAHNGVGISAPQIGVLKRVLVYEYIKPPSSRGKEANIPLRVLINPEVVKSSKKLVIDEEGCLSFPQLYGQVERPGSVRVRAQDIDGKTKEWNATGLEARVIQHELDHLNGVLFIDKLIGGELYTYRPVDETAL